MATSLDLLLKTSEAGSVEIDCITGTPLRLSAIPTGLTDVGPHIMSQPINLTSQLAIKQDLEESFAVHSEVSL
jgi:hypothetical protein